MKPKEILERARGDGVTYVSLQFTDLLGVVKEVVIPVERLELALSHGIWFDGSSVEGFARIQESDLFLKPDVSTYALIPWLSSNGKTARLICDIHRPDGQPFSADPRFVLKKALADAEKMGYRYNVGPEPEFYLFRKSSDAAPATSDSSSYFDIPGHEGTLVIQEILVALKSFGIDVEAAHHEVGHGQYEIDFKYGSAIEIADKLLSLKYTVKRIADRHGFRATFMPKPMMGRPGSGLHVHQSLSSVKSGENLFADANSKYRLSAAAMAFMAGQIQHIKALCSITCPTVNSYKRLVSGFEAPVYIAWGSANRSALIRVPKWFTGRSEAARIELRCPDPSCNPYLAFGAMLYAGLAGIKGNLIPPDPVEENVYEFDSEVLTKKNIDTLPSSLLEAIGEFGKCEMLRESLGSDLFEIYRMVKLREWNDFRVQVTQWEIEEYLDIF